VPATVLSVTAVKKMQYVINKIDDYERTTRPSPIQGLIITPPQLYFMNRWRCIKTMMMMRSRTRGHLALVSRYRRNREVLGASKQTIMAQ